MKRIALALVATGMVVFFISMTAPISGENSKWSTFFLKTRLTEALEKHGYLVVWETKDRTALPPYLGKITEKNDFSPVDDSAVRKLTADGLRATASGAIHFIEVSGAETNVVIGLFERPYRDVPSDKDTQTPPEQSLRYHPLHHWHERREFFLHQWVRMDKGLQYKTLSDFFPLDEVRELSTIMSEKEKNILRTARMFGAILVALGACLFVRHDLRSILKSVRRYRAKRPVPVLPVPLPLRTITSPPASQPTAMHAKPAPHMPVARKQELEPGQKSQKPPSQEWQRILQEIKILHDREHDPDRKKALDEICAMLVSADNRSIGMAQFCLSRAREIASREKRDVSPDTRTVDSLSERFMKLLPIADFVPQYLDAASVQKVLIKMLATSRFGDNPLGYTNLKKSVTGKGVTPEIVEQCINWLDEIRCIIDIKGGREIRRKRAKGSRRYAINMKYKDAPYPGDEIIKLMILADQKMERQSGGRR